MHSWSARAQSLALWLSLVVIAGCRDEQAGPKNRAAPLQSPSGKLLETAPPLTFQSGGTWEQGAISYLGSRAPPVVKPGKRVVLAHYFQARAKPPPGFGLFVHVVDAATGQLVVNADHEIQDGQMPLESWPVGKVIEDVHAVAIPVGAPPELRVLLGFWQGDRRLAVDQPQMHDGQNRMFGPALAVESEALPEYHVTRTAKPPVIDGALTDQVWTKARAVELVNSLDGRKTTVRTMVRLLYDDEHLYVAFDCEDPDVWGTLMKRDDPIYNEEVVEIFIDANGDGRTYNEIEVSPNNTVFDAYFPARRQGMDTSWDSGVKSAVRVRGTLNDPSDRDEGWTVEMAIPIGRLAEVPHLPPRPGDRWRFNLYRLEHIERKRVEGQAFSPLYLGDFHHLPRFGWLVFD